MSHRDPDGFVTRFRDRVLNARDPSAFAEFVSEDFVDHTPREGTGAGQEGFVGWLRELWHGFPDLRWELERVVSEEDTVVVRTMASGTHTGEFRGLAPTGKRVRLSGIHIVRVVDGRVVEHWRHSDELGLLEQLGVDVPVAGRSVAS